MDPFTSGFLASLIANALTTIVTSLVDKTAKSGEIDKLADIIIKDKSLTSVLQKATSSFARQIKGIPKETNDRIKFFLVSPDVDAIVRQIYATKLGSEDILSDREQLKKEFYTTLKLYLKGEIDNVSNFSENLFKSLIDGCDKALDIAINNGFLSAHEAKSAARANLIIGELKAINANLKFLNQSQLPDNNEINAFEDKLRSQIEYRHGFIVPPHFNARRRIPIDELYVIPTLNFSKKKSERHDRNNLSVENFMSFLFRAVVLGNPGSGKSTLANRICSKLASNKIQETLGGRKITPIIVILRDYGRAKKERGLSILQFLYELANSTYQIAPPNNSIERLLLAGRILIIFDGLDELLDTSYRHQVTSDVEAFASLYSNTPILVTSREVGYEQAPLDDNIFDLFHISPFDGDQVKEYVHKWFNTDEEMPKSHRKERADSFLMESKAVPDLSSNPLMLALLCNIYRGENYIPKNRPDVYEKCALMLFEKWDKSRGINVQLPFEAHIRPAMMHLAYWIYSNERLQGGVTENDLIEETTCYLCPRRYEDRDEANEAASEFIEFCRGRAWVFTDTGTTKEGIRYYQFTHRTFLEYFAASYLVRINPTPESLIKKLSPHISNREWDVVAQLACQIQSKQTEGASDKILEKIIYVSNYKNRAIESQINLLSFACRALQFLIPSPFVTKKVVSSSMLCFLRAGEDRYKAKKSKKTQSRRKSLHQTDEIIFAFLTSSKENRNTVFEIFEIILKKAINSNKIESQSVALQLVFNLNSFLFIPWREYMDMDLDLREFCSSFCKKIIDSEKQKIEEISSKDLQTCILAVHSEESNICISDMIKWHGVKSIFSTDDLYISISQGYMSVVPGYLLHMLEFGSAREPGNEKYLDTIKTLLINTAKAIINIPPPWIPSENFEIHKMFRYYLGRQSTLARISNIKWVLKQEPEFIFLLFLAFCSYLEKKNNPAKFILNMSKNIKEKDYVFNIFKNTLKCRLGDGDLKEIQNELKSIKLKRKHISILLSWAKHSISFTNGAIN